MWAKHALLPFDLSLFLLLGTTWHENILTAASAVPPVTPAPSLYLRRPQGRLSPPFRWDDDSDTGSDLDFSDYSDYSSSSSESSNDDNELEILAEYHSLPTSEPTGRIFCFGALPLQQSWPDGHSALDYGGSNKLLCAAEGLPRKNLGFKCNALSEIPHLIFPMPPHEPRELYQAFKEHCRLHCRCLRTRRPSNLAVISEDREDEDSEIEDESSITESRPFVNGQRINRANGGIVLETLFTSDGVVYTSSSTVADSRNRQLATPVPAANWLDTVTVTEKCGSSCSSFSGCGDSDCRCVARRRPFPGIKEVDNFLFLGICALLKRPVHKLNGRDLMPEKEELCPCNQSYVSKGCCDTPGGLVWENSDQKRGELGPWL